jgi:methionyl-tRNA synthetase
VQKVNSTLVSKVINLASRSARFLQHVGFAEQYPDDGGLFESARRAGDEIAEAYESFDYSRAIRTIMALADRANEYVDRMQPWALAKQPADAQRLREVCTVCLNLFRQVVVYLAPVLPELATRSSEFLRASVATWQDAQTPMLGHDIGEYQHLMRRVEPSNVQALVAASVVTPVSDATTPAATQPGNNAAVTEFNDDGAALTAEPLAEQCTIDAFNAVDLRVARVLHAEEVAAAKKLLKLTLTLGGEHTRTVFAGIKAAYDPAQLVGRLVVMVANLKPREMKFGTSEGMVIAAGPGEREVFLLAPDSGAKPGQRVH